MNAPADTPARVLLVEDDETLRTVVADALRDNGYVVATLADGETCVRRASPALKRRTLPGTAKKELGQAEAEASMAEAEASLAGGSLAGGSLAGASPLRSRRSHGPGRWMRRRHSLRR